MPRKPTDEKIAALRKKQEEIDRQIRAHEKQIKEQERKRHTTKLIAYGLLVQYELQSGTRDEAEVHKKLDRLLTQNSHRAAIGLELLGIAGKSSKPAPDEPVSNARKVPTHGTKSNTTNTEKKPGERSKTDTSKPRPKRELVTRDEEELAEHFNM